MKSSGKNKIIYVTPSLSSFVRNDISILSKQYPVIVNTYAWDKKILTPLYLFHQFFFLLRHIRSAKRIFVSFGGYWSFFPALIGKLAGVKTYIILNGTDCASIPPLHYGNLRSNPLKWFCKQSYQLATQLLPVSSSLISVRNTYFSDDAFSFQVYRHFFPKLKTPNLVIHNGFDENFWKMQKNTNKKTKSFLAVFSTSQFVLKGGDLIVQLSRKFPDCKFYIAGTDKPDNLKTDNKNLLFLGKLTPEKLREYYNFSQFYLQLSVFEGFGCSLAEAMLCECIPIGSSVNIIPEIIGETGFILEKRDVTALEKVVHKALTVENKKSLGQRARERIVKNYTMVKRERELFSLISK